MKLFIAGLPYDITESELEEIFLNYGELISANLVKDQFTGHPRGFAFIEMATRSGGQQAMEGLNKKKYKNKTLVCKEATAKKKKKRYR